MTKKRQEHADEIRRRLEVEYPDATCALDFGNPLQLLVATILSAQCTDARVNEVTPALFAKYPDAQAFAEAPQEDLEEFIRSTGFFRSKAKSIREACRVIHEKHAGQVPGSMEELTPLAGVGRKTAAVVLGNAFGVNEGLAVDTHVGRLSQRLALSHGRSPDSVEHDLMRLFPRETWTMIAHQIIAHGRKVCHARKPRCGECILADICPSREE